MTRTIHLSTVLAWARALPANEPVVLGQAVSGLLTVGVTLGLHLAPPQILTIGAAVTAVTTIILRAVCSPASPASPPQKGPSP